MFCKNISCDEIVACLACRTICAEYDKGLLAVGLVVELVVAGYVHDDRSLIYPLSKCCDANCDELASCGIRCQVKCFSVARCDPEVTSEVGFVQLSKDGRLVRRLFDTRNAHYKLVRCQCRLYRCSEHERPTGWLFIKCGVWRRLSTCTTVSTAVIPTLPDQPLA